MSTRSGRQRRRRAPEWRSLACFGERARSDRPSARCRPRRPFLGGSGHYAGKGRGVPASGPRRSVMSALGTKLGNVCWRKADQAWGHSPSRFDLNDSKSETGSHFRHPGQPVHLEDGCAISRSQEVKSLRSRNVPKLGEVWPNFQRAFLDSPSPSSNPGTPATQSGLYIELPNVGNVRDISGR
jgi:hypothetical protein